MTQEILYRSITVDNSAIDIPNRCVSIAFSSETPYQRAFGLEVLSHLPADVDMSFIASGNAPLLLEHEVEDQIGVVESAYIESGVGRAVVRFSKSEDGEKVWQDVIDGIRKNISVGYIITDKRQEQRGNDQIVLCSWAPKEISFVAMPADETVGVGRTAELTAENKDQNNNKEVEMDNTEKDVAVEARAADIVIDTQAILKTERARSQDITDLATQFNMRSVGDELIRSGKTVDEARAVILSELAKRPTVQAQATIGLSEKEAKQFSLARALDAMVSGNWTKSGFELEVSSEIAKRSNKIQTSNNVFIPTEYRAADANAVTAAGQASLVNVSKIGFVDMLYNNTIASQLGVQQMTGLVGTVQIPRILTGPKAKKVAEGEDGTVEGITSDLVTLSPNQLISLTELTNSMLKNSTAIEARLQAALLNDITVKIDTEVFAAILSDAAIAWQTKPTELTYADIRKLVAIVAKNNALTSNAKFASDYDVQTLLATTLIGPNTIGKYLLGDDGKVAGRDLLSSNHVGANLIFGDFSNATAGFWGTVELAINPYEKFASGGLQLRAMVDMDVAVTRQKAFTGFKALV